MELYALKKGEGFQPLLHRFVYHSCTSFLEGVDCSPFMD